jgi:transforming growth factor-beta-induced protein
MAGFFTALLLSCTILSASALDIVATAQGTGSHNVLAEALTKANLVSTLEGTGPFTVFAPTDAAFESALQALGMTKDDLLNMQNLADILTYHVLSGKTMSTDLQATQTVATVNGLPVTITKGTDVKFADAIVTGADVDCNNGVIHVIDKVILPPTVDIVSTAIWTGQHSILAEALTKAQLVSTLQEDGPFTVFAPTDAAFESALQALGITATDLLNMPNLASILKYHVLAGKVMSTDLQATQTTATLNTLPVTITKGSEVRFADANVTGADVACSNGVIHVIDKVVLSPTLDIVATALSTGQHTILAEALTKADLVSALQGPGPFTVFAPTDAAFAAALQALGKTKDELLNMPDLAEILKYHVLSGVVLSGDLRYPMTTVATLNPQKVTITKDSNGVKFADAQVTQADVRATNGVIHVIDKVVLPPASSTASGDTILQAAKNTGTFTSLVTALEAAGLAQVFDEPGSYTVFAPTDDAFAGLLTSLNLEASALQDANVFPPASLANILKYHVATSLLGSGELVDQMTIQTLQGGRLVVTISDVDGVKINTAKVTTADIQCTNGVIHVIDAVLTPGDRLTIGGGSQEWDKSQWNVVLDGVMGGKSSGSVDVKDGKMVFAGSISLDGGGFSSVRKAISGDLSTYAGIYLETDAIPYTAHGTALGVHVTLSDASWYDFSAPVAIPMSDSESRFQVLLPWSQFDHASRVGYKASGEEVVDLTTVNQISIYVLFQEGPFELHIHEISAVKRLEDGPGQPTAPDLQALASAQSVSTLIQQAINNGVSLFNQGYEGLCEQLYSAAARAVLATPEAMPSARSAGCAGLANANMDRSSNAWILRRAIDAIYQDAEGHTRNSAHLYPEFAQGAWLPGTDAAPSKECVWMLEGHAYPKMMAAMAAPSPTPATPSPSSLDGVSGDVNGFLGPFVEKGISGHNDFDLVYVQNPRECAELCQQTNNCRSFDYGARSNVLGECWRSTANRESAGSAYERWEKYDYYERIIEEVKLGDVNAVGADNTRTGSEGFMEATALYSGVMSFDLTGASMEQVQMASKKFLAEQFKVDENMVAVSAKESAGSWVVDFDITASSSQLSSMKSTAANLAANSDGLKVGMAKHLGAAGVDATVAESMQVSSFSAPWSQNTPSQQSAAPASSNADSDGDNTLMFIVIGIGAVIAVLLATIACLLYRRANTPLPKQVVVAVAGQPISPYDNAEGKDTDFTPVATNNAVVGVPVQGP